MNCLAPDPSGLVDGQGIVPKKGFTHRGNGTQLEYYSAACRFPSSWDSGTGAVWWTKRCGSGQRVIGLGTRTIAGRAAAVMSSALAVPSANGVRPRQMLLLSSGESELSGAVYFTSMNVLKELFGEAWITTQCGCKCM